MTEEFELPTYEALLAGTMALMTRYAQAAQADLDPAGRLATSWRIAENLSALRRCSEASDTLRQLVDRLAGCWWQMVCCTAGSTPPCAPGAAQDRPLH